MSSDAPSNNNVSDFSLEAKRKQKRVSTYLNRQNSLRPIKEVPKVFQIQNDQQISAAEAYNQPMTRK